jgi:hypothetical protein
MTIAAYEAMNAAFTSSSIQQSDRAALQEYLVLLCSRNEVNPYIQHRDIIRGITINQILMQRHIDSLNKQNEKTQKLVIALTIAALISGFAQTIATVLPYAGVFPPQPTASAPQTLRPKLSSPISEMLLAPDAPTKKSP